MIKSRDLNWEHFFPIAVHASVLNQSQNSSIVNLTREFWSYVIFNVSSDHLSSCSSIHQHCMGAMDGNQCSAQCTSAYTTPLHTSTGSNNLNLDIFYPCFVKPQEGFLSPPVQYEILQIQSYLHFTHQCTLK